MTEQNVQIDIAEIEKTLGSLQLTIIQLKQIIKNQQEEITRVTKELIEINKVLSETDG